jgi:hopanoid biosynthesis associated protein HpnK
VITADDFGLAREVNEAVEIAHRSGVLSAADLMVAAPAAADAIERVRTMPRLRVGLHLALTDAWPATLASRIPGLVDGAGRLRADLARLGLQLARDGRSRRQMREEIAAQFALFRNTGLPLDHVSVHQHYLLHPIIGAMVIDVGRAHGVEALRVPYEPSRIIGRVETDGQPAARAAETLCAAWLRLQAKRAGLTTTDGVFGLRWSGRMTAARLAGLVENLPPGFWEIYLHPAVRDAFPDSAPGYRYAEELAALTDAGVINALRRRRLDAAGYRDT